MPDNEALPAVATWHQRLWTGLKKSRTSLGDGITSLVTPARLDDNSLQELEDLLLQSDMGVSTTQHVLAQVQQQLQKRGSNSAMVVRDALREVLYTLLQPLQQPLDIVAHSPFVIIFCGVNGAGKTTSIGKLAQHFQADGKSVLLAAGDTFRAAAREQLQRWGERNEIPVISQASGDPAALSFDAINAARARQVDILLADTAGRLPTQAHLMQEIAKVRRVMHKAMPGAPHESMLVLDANSGQNCLQQIRAFDEAVGVSGLLVTKLDGTARAGYLAAIAHLYPKPVRYIGVGESLHDLHAFQAHEFVDALLP